MFARLVREPKKKDIENIVLDENDEIQIESENLTVQWVHAYLEEIERIEKFFQSKQYELIDQFINLQDKFRMKTDQHLQQQQQDLEKKRKERQKKQA